MKIHITNLYGMNSRGTQIISQRSVVKVAKELGFKEMSLYVYRVQSDTEGELRKRLDGITSSVEDGDIVIAQLPSWNLTRYDKALLDVIRMRRNVKIAVFIHDFVPMMFGGTELDYHQTIEVYNMADLLIVPSESLLDFLQEKGLKVEKVLFQPMWDVPFSGELQIPEFRRQIFFSGSPERFQFVFSWNYDIPLKCFTYDNFEVKGPNIQAEGWRNAIELLTEYARGGFGLVWEQTSQAHYYRYNQPHKLCTYLAAGIPVIMQRGLLHERTVQERGLGFVVDSLEEAADIVKRISEEEYQELVSNIRNISFLIREGFFTKKLLIDTVNYLMLG